MSYGARNVGARSGTRESEGCWAVDCQAKVSLLQICIWIVHMNSEARCKWRHYVCCCTHQLIAEDKSWECVRTSSGRRRRATRVRKTVFGESAMRAKLEALDKYLEGGKHIKPDEAEFLTQWHYLLPPNSTTVRKLSSTPRQKRPSRA